MVSAVGIRNYGEKREVGGEEREVKSRGAKEEKRRERKKEGKGRVPQLDSKL